MSKVTSKRQVTIPKAIADEYAIGPGAEIEFLPAGDTIRLLPPTSKPATIDPARRLGSFDRATERQQARQGATAGGGPADRGWQRDELYERAGAR